MKFYIYIFLLNVLASSLVAAEGTNTSPASRTVHIGKQIYLNHCKLCHGINGDGNGPAAAVTNPKPRNFLNDNFTNGDTPEQIFSTITKGMPNTAMIAWKDMLTDIQRRAVANYILEIRSSYKKKVLSTPN